MKLKCPKLVREVMKRLKKLVDDPKKCTKANTVYAEFSTKTGQFTDIDSI